MLELSRQILLHPLPAAAGITAVTIALVLFVARVPSRSWVPPTVVGMSLLVEGITTFSAIHLFMTAFRASPPPMAREGLRQVAATILESRVPGLVGAVVLLALAVVGFASILATRVPAEAAAALTPGADWRVRQAITFVMSALAVLLVVVLALWETRQASSIVRTFAEAPVDFTLVLRSPAGDHAHIGIGVASQGFLCLLSVAGGLLLALLAQALASAEAPPVWLRRGYVIFLSVIAFVAVAALAGGLAQRTWLRAVVAAGNVPGVVPKMATASARIPPCRSHSSSTGVANLADVYEPVLLERVPPAYPEFARRAGAQGDVLLEAVVEKDGTVSFVCVLRGVDPGLDEAAGKAVLQWQYRPATRRSDGVPVPVYLPVTVTFRLE